VSSMRSKLVTGAAIGAAALSGGAIANAASSSSTATPAPSSSPSGQPPSGKPQGPHTVNGKAEQPLTGSVEAKVRAAALAKVKGTVERVETNVDSSAPYEAHITKAD